MTRKSRGLYHRPITLLTALTLVAALLPVLVASVSSADEHLSTGAPVVISQVYGGGGNSGAPFTHDFVELFNRSGEAVDLTGWSIQYQTQGSTSWTVIATLSGVVESGQYYLVQQASGGSSGVALPDPDASGTQNMNATQAKVALVDNAATLSTGCPTEQMVDLVGYGSATQACHEGSGAAPTLSNTTAAHRALEGCVDTDDNASDFSVAAPGPRNTASPLNDCADELPPPPSDAPVVISQLYGGGGNSGAFYRNDFIEVFNRSGGPVDLTGWSVQYASQAGSSWAVTPLSGVLQPGQYYLIQQAAGANVNAESLPEPDATGTTNMSATNGKVALVSSTTALSGICGDGTDFRDDVVDFVGFGGGANCFEGDGGTPTLANNTAALRLDGGCVDTDRNDADFVTATPPTPRNTGSPRNYCVGSPVVISQVYGGGGNSGAFYRNDFIEVFNRGVDAVDLTGWSVQYAPATSASWSVVSLSGTLEPGQYYLIQQAAGANVGAEPLPDPDATGTTNMNATSAKVALAATTTALSGTCPTEDVIDFVGYGTNANCFEGSGPTPNLGNNVAALRDLDGCVDTDDNSSDFVTISPPTPRNTASPFNDCEPDEPPPPPRVCPEPPEVSPISMVQGPGNVTPCDGELVVIEGIVVGDYQGPAPNLRGFYVQSRDEDWDDDPLTSEGIFVFNGNFVDVSLGDLVRVTGVAAEFQEQTQLSVPAAIFDHGLTPAQAIQVLGGGHTVMITDVHLPFPDPVDGVDFLERFEGMLVRFPQTLFVTEFFQLGRFGQIVVSSGDRLPQPTSIAEPGAAANAVQAENDRNRIVLDDHLNNQNPDPILFGRGGDPLTAENTLRGGDTVEDAVGVMTFGWAGHPASPNAYRLRIVADPDLVADPDYPGSLPGDFEHVVPPFEAVNERPDGPPDVGGSLVISNFNVLNYFLTLDVFGSPDRNIACGPVGSRQACRGAQTELEFERQRIKLLQALVMLDSDIVGLIELENSDGVEPLTDIVAGLNDLLGDGTYDFVDTGIVGTDVIKVGFIYRPATVSLLGDTALLDSSVDPRFDDTRSRPALAQTFTENATGEVFTAVVNHLKSKGCGGATGLDLDQGDGQACWNPTRTAAATAMVDWLMTYPTGVVDDDFMVMGDLNSYAMEDPIAVFTDAGYVNLIEHFGGTFAYSFVFDGQWGYLDHALVTPSLFDQVTGAAEYHINADEPSVLDYTTTFKSANQVEILFAPDEFRTSDHDPVLVGTALDGNLATMTVASPDLLWPPNHKYVEVTVTSTANGTPLDVAILHVASSEADSGLGPDDLPDDIVITSNSTVDLRAERFSTAGRTYTITVLVSTPLGSEDFETMQSMVDVVTVFVPHNLGQGPL
jgi:uncharacterized protein